MGLFDFHLRPLADVQPWGTAPDLSLSWFGLTDGFYRLSVGDDLLFSCSVDASRLLAANYPGFQGDYADYQVVRLWEDICEILPDVLTPVPPELGRLLAGPTPVVKQWLNHADAWLIPDETGPDADIDSARYDLFDDAVSWLGYRRLDSLYLQGGPRIWLWSTPDEVTLTWDNRELQFEGVERWSALHGSFTMSRAVFMSELHAFDEDFLNQMSQRVEEVCAAWPRPEIRIDFAGLRREHAERTQTLAKALTTARKHPTGKSSSPPQTPSASRPNSRHPAGSSQPMPARLKVLFVCAMNKQRSVTAERLYRNDARLEVRSAGVNAKAARRISEADLNWADLVYVMESDQKTWIRSRFPDLDLPKIEVLDIPDDFPAMDPELQTMLRAMLDPEFAHLCGD